MGHINRLKEQCDRKILILDGAMGTEIQKYNLTEEDFRGERFADVPGQMKGNNDVLNLTRPDVISDIYRRYLEVIIESYFHGMLLFSLSLSAQRSFQFVR